MDYPAADDENGGFRLNAIPRFFAAVTLFLIIAYLLLPHGMRPVLGVASQEGTLTIMLGAFLLFIFLSAIFDLAIFITTPEKERIDGYMRDYRKWKESHLFRLETNESFDLAEGENIVIGMRPCHIKWPPVKRGRRGMVREVAVTNKRILVGSIFITRQSFGSINFWGMGLDPSGEKDLLNSGLRRNFTITEIRYGETDGMPHIDIRTSNYHWKTRIFHPRAKEIAKLFGAQ
ncbi:MAG: hypothetical protein ABIH29_05990 [Candidatus Micrarchaeota archaeon]